MRPATRGIEVIDRFLPAERCRALLDRIRAHARAHEPPLIERAQPRRSLRYRVIDGERVHAHLPELVAVQDDVLRLARRFGPDHIAPIDDRAVGLNVNITPRGGEYRWHYDRTMVTGILYLNRVRGGETEAYPNHRLLVDPARHPRLQRWLDAAVAAPPILRALGRLERVVPAEGRLLLMRGDRTLHSVAPVDDDEERVTVIMAFDRPGAVFGQAAELDKYLYSKSADPGFDPNYGRRP